MTRRPWRGQLFSFLLFLQAVLAGLAMHLRQPQVWQGVLAAAALVNVIGWLRALRIARAIQDTPTSRVASAAQGYVELHGRAQPHEGQQLLTPHTQLPCLWYRYRVERREGDKWQHVDSAESLAPFDLEDGSGRCTLEPAGAHIQTTHREVRRDGDLRHTEEILLKDDRLYAIGAFHSRGGADLVLDAHREVGELLAEWKQDQAELRRRFDLDGDGDISPKEWALARMAARREITRQHQELRAQAPRHILFRPGDGRPYLISNLPPEAMGSRYAWLARLFLGLLLACLAGLAWLIKGVS